MIKKIQTRLASEQGFTLIELLVVIVILGILVAIAVPAYLSFRGSANDAAAKSNVRSAVPAAEGFYQSNTANPNSYTGMDTAGALAAESPGIASSLVVHVSADGASYCVEDTQNGYTYSYVGGNDASDASIHGGEVYQQACPALA